MEVNPGYKQTKVGVIPEEWEACQLSDISTKITDGDHLTPKRERAGYYLLSARNVQDGSIDLTDVDYVGVNEYRRMRNRCAPEVGDLLISCSGHGLGRVSNVPVGLECVLVRSAALVKLAPEKANSFFVQYWLQGAHAQKQISTSKSLAAQPNLFINNIERLRCPIPPLPEQRAIAEALSDVDAFLGALGRLIAKKRDLKQAAMQQLLTGQTRLPGFETKPGYKRTDVGVIPEDWDDTLLDRIAKRGSGHTPDKKHPEYWNGNIKWISLADSSALDRVFIDDTFAKVTPEGIANSSATLHPAGTVVLSRDAGVGKSAIMRTEMAVSQHFMAWCCGPELDNHYLYYWLQVAKPEFERIANGSTIKTIGLPYFKDLKIPKPPLPEQRAIAAVLSEMDAELATLEQRQAKTRALKQGMMQELLTGRTRLI